METLLTLNLGLNSYMTIELHEPLQNCPLGMNPSQVTKVNVSKEEFVCNQIMEVLKQNMDQFVWCPADMPGIELGFLCHQR